MHTVQSAHAHTAGPALRGVSLGAAATTVLVLFGISVPFASIASLSMLTGIEVALLPVTLAVTNVPPMLFVIGSVLLVIMLFAKERLLQPRAAMVVNNSSAAAALLIGLAMLFVVTMPIISAGESLAGR